MNRESENLRLDLSQILGFTVVGGVRYQNVILAQKHTAEWQGSGRPGVAPGPVVICGQCARDRESGPACEHCGATSTVSLRSGGFSESEERLEDRKVAFQAAKDAETLRQLLPAWRAALVIAGAVGAPTRELSEVSRRLAQIIVRNVTPVDHSKLPPVEEPGCVSCDRLNRWKGWRDGRIWQPVSSQDRYSRKGLCSWCGKHGVPDVEWVALRHRDGEHKAGRALAKLEQQKGAA